MIAKLQTYPKYKNSGIEWLGVIPSEWDILPFKKIFKLSNERVENTPSLDLALSVSGYRGVEPRNIESMEGQMPSEDIGKYRIVRRGQLAVNTMWLNYAGLGVSDYEGYISPAYRSYNIDRAVNKKFVHHLLRSPLYIQKYTSMLYGLRPNSLQVKNDDFEKIEILVPPPETQKKIADFLDEKTKIIDELVAKKEKLIELLREKRAVLITHAVTKGLDLKAKMKPSGIDWLGDIPEEWGVKRLKFVSNYVKTGSTPDSEKQEYFDFGNIPWFTPGDFNEKIDLNDASKKITSKAVIDGKARLFRKDSILLVGIGATLGKIGFCKTEFSANQQINVIYINNSNLPRFYAYYLLAIAEIIISTSNASTLGILNQEKTKQILCVVPSKQEQIKIVEYIDKQWTEFENVMKKVKNQIGQLKEYRSSLIYSAVTGKVKV